MMKDSLPVIEKTYLKVQGEKPLKPTKAPAKTASKPSAKTVKTA
jgi:hypothetical protein